MKNRELIIKVIPTVSVNSFSYLTLSYSPLNIYLIELTMKKNFIDLFRKKQQSYII